MFKKIWNGLLGKPDNAVEAQQELCDVIVEYLNEKFSGAEETFTDTVVVWVSNSQQVKQSYVRNKKFENKLRLKLENYQLDAISKATIEFKTENPPQELDLPEIAEGIGVYIQFVPTKEEKICTKAKITIANRKGSLKKKEYILDTHKIQTEYKIGRDENNYIVITQDDKKLYESVSRTHAKIIFLVGRGFYLQSLNINNRTIINRNNQRVADLTDENTKVLLYDKDEIELGKSVCLKFNIIVGNKR